jgi:hypothetical protein
MAGLGPRVPARGEFQQNIKDVIGRQKASRDETLYPKRA